MKKIKLTTFILLFFVSPILSASTCNYGSQYLERSEYKRAYKTFKNLSTLNDACSMYYLGIMYQNGFYVKQSNIKAQEYIRKSAKHGFIPTKEMEAQLSD